MGLRPAEKLYEELLIGDNVTSTEHPRILRAMEHSLPWERVQASLNELLAVMRRFDCGRARELLLNTVAEYKPNMSIEDLVSRQHAVAASEFVAEPVSGRTASLLSPRASTS